jgi:hypothetical protein
MNAHDGKKVGNDERPRLTVLAGGKAGDARTHAELELDRAMRALFYAMRDTRGRMPGKNVRNVARGATHPWRMLAKRFRDAKRARYPQHNYPLVKETVRELDRYVDRLFGKDVTTTGDFPRVA